MCNSLPLSIIAFASLMVASASASPLADVERTPSYQILRQEVRRGEQAAPPVHQHSTYARIFREARLRREIATLLLPSNLKDRRILKFTTVDSHIVIGGTIPPSEERLSRVELEITLPHPSRFSAVEHGIDIVLRRANIPEYERSSSQVLETKVLNQDAELITRLDARCVLKIPLPRHGVALLTASSCDYSEDLLAILQEFNWSTFAGRLAA